MRFGIPPREPFGGRRGCASARARANLAFRPRRFAALAAASLAVACSDGGTVSHPPDTPEPDGQPAGWDAEIALPQAVDRNPDPNVVEVDVEARVAPVPIVPGTMTTIWSYDGSLPGPMIRAKRGDRVIVHFTNHLPEATTIHWHGMRVPAAMDGAPGHSQPPIEPGGSFTYDFIVPDAALFWYHPHLNSSTQVSSGLYAPFLVDDPEDPLKGMDEVVLVLSDIALTADGSLDDPDAGGDFGALFGREGNYMLVNGKFRPTLTVRPGRALRLRIVNTARARYFQLGLEGHRFRRIGGDGGLMEYPVDSDTVVVIPAGRSDVVFVPQGVAGEVLPVRWIPYDRGYGSTFNRPEEDLFYLKLAEPAPTVDPLPVTSRHIEPLATEGATPVDLRLTIQSGRGEPLELGINDVPYSKAEPVRAVIGETQVWSMTNTFDFAHPMHIHGFFFQVLDVNGVPARPLEWLDTVDVPVEATTRVVIRYEDRPGMWMFHCHLLDHAEAGMMGMLELTEANQPNPPTAPHMGH